MAIVKCKECGTEISDKAKICPKCGAPIPAKTSLLTWIVGGIVAMIFINIILNNNSEVTPNSIESSVKTDEEVKQENSNFAALMGAKQLKHSMRNPDSLEFETVLITENNDVCYKYRGQNGFGGMGIEYAVLTSKGNMYNNKPDLFNKKCDNVKNRDITTLIKHAPL